MPNITQIDIPYRRQGSLTRVDNTIGIDEAFRYTQARPTLTKKYLTKCQQQGWRETDLRKSSQWALWFTKTILTDRWPAGEMLLESDADLHRNYLEYVDLLNAIGMMDHTIGDHQIKRDREEAAAGLQRAHVALYYGEPVPARACPN